MASTHVSRCALVLWLLTISGARLKTVSAEDLVVSTDKGQVRGFAQNAHENMTVSTFLGIPFAAPPLGELRFKPPVQLEPWEGVRDARRLPNSCHQMVWSRFGNFSGATMWDPNTPQSEDCLYLNVWVPQTMTPKKAVIVWIHGGGFFSGTSTLDIYDGKYLAAENDVIVVSLQYRLGIMGFLTLNTPDAPGNVGLWDQRMALEWINRNIHNFGGDPQSVTLMGESAGSACVGLLLMCDLCRGYFHKAILQSGSANAKWATITTEEMWRRSNIIAENVKCGGEGSTAEDRIACLRKVDADVLTMNSFRGTVGGSFQTVFTPHVDGILIRHDPKDMLKKGFFKKIPILLGATSQEGSYFLMYSDPDVFSLAPSVQVSRSDYERVIDDYFFKYYQHYPTELSELGRNAVKFYYRNWLDPENFTENLNSLDSSISDCFIVCPLNNMALAYAREDAPVYYYWFQQRWSANPWPEWMGVLHGDEMWFTFGHPFNPELSFTPEEKELSRNLMTYIGNFAKYGSPTYPPNEAEWPRFTQEEQKYRYLDAEPGFELGQHPRTQQCAFWDVYMQELLENEVKCNSQDPESMWVEKFDSWKQRYVEGWNDQMDSFLNSYKTKARQCMEEP